MSAMMSSVVDSVINCSALWERMQVTRYRINTINAYVKMASNDSDRWIAAFDLGTKNFAFAVKRGSTNQDDDGYVLLKNVAVDPTPPTSKSGLGKLLKERLREMVKEHLGIPSADLKKKDMIVLLSKHLKKMVRNEPSIDMGMLLFKIMDEHTLYWDRCKVFLIERQMTANVQALKMAHYLEAYLKIKYLSVEPPIHVIQPNIVNYSSAAKTVKLGAPKLVSKKQRKNWTVSYAERILKGDNLRSFQSMVKKDDVADVVCMIESF